MRKLAENQHGDNNRVSGNIMTATRLIRRRKRKVQVVKSEHGAIVKAGFRQSDLTRMLRACKQMGIPVERVEILDGQRRLMVMTKPANGGDDTPSGYLSVLEACAYARMGRTRIYELIAAGELRIKKLGSRTLVSKSSIDKLMARLTSKR